MFSGFGSYDGNFGGIPQKFEDYFRCYPICTMNERIRKDEANYGGKIFLPPSALNKLSMLNIRYPMLFKLSNQETGRVTHGGVLEFVAEEGRAYLPEWMMETLGVQPGSLLQIGSTDLAQGSYVKLQPQSIDFLDISDPKAVLENVLRKFSTLSVDDVIAISYNSKVYRIKVLDLKPETESRSICVIETDLVTDFAAPVGYVEPDYAAGGNQGQPVKGAIGRRPSQVEPGSMSQRISYGDLVKKAGKTQSAFTGEGQRLSGKAVKRDSPGQEAARPQITLDGPPAPLHLAEGQLFFGFPIVPGKEDDYEGEKGAEEKPHFRSGGQSLRQRNKRRGGQEHEVQRAKAPKSPEVIQID